MSLVIAVRQQNLDKFQRRLNGIKLQLREFRKTKLTEIATARLIESIKLKMTVANYSQSTIESTRIENVEIFSNPDVYLIKIASDVFEQGQDFNLDIPREFGAEPYTIFPKSPDGVLVFEIEGETIFTKFADHPGFKALNIINRTVDEEEEGIETEFNEEEKLWLSLNMRDL